MSDEPSAKATPAEPDEGDKHDQKSASHSPMQLIGNLSRKGLAALGAVCPGPQRI